MAFTTTKLIAVVLASFLASSLMITARKLDSKSTLRTRLKLDEEGSSSCWDALFELQSCSGEVVMFFLNGETHLGSNCCNAIKTIEHECWPSMLGTLGITTEETNILRGYCDATTAESVFPSPPPKSLHKCYDLPRLLP